MRAQDEPPSLQDETELEVPQALEDLLRACLAKDPADRPASMADLVTRLRELQVITDPQGDAWPEDACRAWWEKIPEPDFSADDSAEAGLASLHHRAPVDTAAAALAAMDTE